MGVEDITKCSICKTECEYGEMYEYEGDLSCEKCFKKIQSDNLDKLPKNWCIKVSISGIKYEPNVVYDWRVKNFGLLNGGRWSWDGYINNYGQHSVNLCSLEQEITLEQFEHFVLGKRKFRLWKLKTL